MPYRPMGVSGGGGGPLPDKTVGWLWGYLCGSILTPALVYGYWWFWHLGR